MKPKSSAEGQPVLITFRLPGSSTDPFLAETEAWLDEVRADFREQMGAELPGNGVLFAHDVLVEMHGAKASWARFDVAAFERWVHENEPAFACMLPTMLADLACFTNYLARTGRFPVEQAIAVEKRTMALFAAMLDARRKPGTFDN